MTIVEKLKNLVSPAKWAQGFLMKKFGKRAAQFGAAALVAFLANPKLTDFLYRYGGSINVDQDKLADALCIVIAALLGGLFNTAKHGPLKTVNDDPKGPPAPITPQPEPPK